MLNLPPYKVYPVLLSGRIRMRQLLHSDIPSVLEICYFNNKLAKDEEEARSNVDKIEERYQSGNSIHWLIEDITTKEIVGTCGFYRGFANHSGEVGYVMKEKFRRCGYMTEAVSLALDYGFNVMKLKLIFATTAPENLASQSVLRKNGFVAAGTAEDGHLRFQIVR